MFLYLIDVANSLKMYFGFGIFVGLIITLFTLIASTDQENARASFWVVWKRFLVGGITTFIVSTFMYLALPTTKTMYLMLGTVVAQEVVTNPAVQRIGTRIESLIDEKLDALSDKKKLEKKSE